MPEAIIHTTVDQLARDLASFAGSRHVEVRILDATEEENRASVCRAVEEADDDAVSLTEDKVFGDIYRMLQERHGITR
jgi:hypothetical protein